MTLLPVDQSCFVSRYAWQRRLLHPCTVGSAAFVSDAQKAVMYCWGPGGQDRAVCMKVRTSIIGSYNSQFEA